MNTFCIPWRCYQVSSEFYYADHYFCTIQSYGCIAHVAKLPLQLKGLRGRAGFCSPLCRIPSGNNQRSQLCCECCLCVCKREIKAWLQFWPREALPSSSTWRQHLLPSCPFRPTAPSKCRKHCLIFLLAFYASPCNSILVAEKHVSVKGVCKKAATKCLVLGMNEPLKLQPVFYDSVLLVGTKGINFWLLSAVGGDFCEMPGRGWCVSLHTVMKYGRF